MKVYIACSWGDVVSGTVKALERLGEMVVTCIESIDLSSPFLDHWIDEIVPVSHYGGVNCDSARALRRDLECRGVEHVLKGHIGLTLTPRCILNLTQYSDAPDSRQPLNHITMC